MKIENTAVYQKIISEMENGVLPWKKPWTGKFPCNGRSGHVYTGINFFTLIDSEFGDRRWYTFKQVKELGGYVNQGSKSQSIVFWNFNEYEDASGQKKTIPMLKMFHVFNYEQCSNMPQEAVKDFVSNLDADSIVKGYDNIPKVLHGSLKASYSPQLDTVNMPNKNDFHSPDAYYAVLFHELAHSTGHEKRLNRSTLTAQTYFGTEVYSEEELVAEFTSAFLCNYAKIDNTLENSASYIENWLSAIKSKPNILMSSASKAQAATNYILGV